MAGRIVGIVEAVAPMRLLVARARGQLPRLGARVSVDGLQGRVVDVIGRVDEPYIVIRLDDPSRAIQVEPGAEVSLAERPRRRGRGRKRGRRRVQGRPNRNRGRKAGVQRHRRGGKRADHNR